VLAVRAGVSRAWGPYPWFESPAVGGEGSLRGYDVGRFAGNTATYGGADLRARLFGFSLGLPGDVGLLALTDVGRVWLDGEDSGRWHSAWGGGMWVSVVDASATLSATLADGERTMLYVRGGFAF
jgi:hemolysin activation/secretion protein